jgi:hypothetical protein
LPVDHIISVVAQEIPVDPDFRIVLELDVEDHHLHHHLRRNAIRLLDFRQNLRQILGRVADDHGVVLFVDRHHAKRCHHLVQYGLETRGIEELQHDGLQQKIGSLLRHFLRSCFRRFGLYRGGRRGHGLDCGKRVFPSDGIAAAV